MAQLSASMAAMSIGSGHTGEYVDPLTGITFYNDRVFVGGLSLSTTEADLQHCFDRFGVVKSVKIIRAMDGNSKGYGFVTYEHIPDVKSLLQRNEMVELHGRRLNIGQAKRNVTGQGVGSAVVPGTMMLPNGQVVGGPGLNYCSFMPPAVPQPLTMGSVSDISSASVTSGSNNLLRSVSYPAMPNGSIIQGPYPNMMQDPGLMATSAGLKFPGPMGPGQMMPMYPSQDGLSAQPMMQPGPQPLMTQLCLPSPQPQEVATAQYVAGMPTMSGPVGSMGIYYGQSGPQDFGGRESGIGSELMISPQGPYQMPYTPGADSSGRPSSSGYSPSNESDQVFLDMARANGLPTMPGIPMLSPPTWQNGGATPLAPSVGPGCWPIDPHTGAPVPFIPPPPAPVFMPVPMVTGSHVEQVPIQASTLAAVTAPSTRPPPPQGSSQPYSFVQPGASPNHNMTKAKPPSIKNQVVPQPPSSLSSTTSTPVAASPAKDYRQAPSRPVQPRGGYSPRHGARMPQGGGYRSLPGSPMTTPRFPIQSRTQRPLFEPSKMRSPDHAKRMPDGDTTPRARYSGPRTTTPRYTRPALVK